MKILFKLPERITFCSLAFPWVPFNVFINSQQRWKQQKCDSSGLFQTAIQNRPRCAKPEWAVEHFSGNRHHEPGAQRFPRKHARPRGPRQTPAPRVSFPEAVLNVRGQPRVWTSSGFGSYVLAKATHSTANSGLEALVMIILKYKKCIFKIYKSSRVLD